MTYLLNAIFKSLLGQTTRTLHRLAVIVGPPAGTVDVHMVWIEPDGARLDGVRHNPIQHPDA